MTRNCVTLDATGEILRYGACDFENDGTFDIATETYHTDVSPKLSNLPLEYTKIVAGVVTEMLQSEKDVIDTNNVNNAIGTVISKSRRVLESIGADVNIEWRPYVSQITAYTSEISLSDGTFEGQEKKVYNDDTTAAIFINGTYAQGTQMRINNNQYAVLLWNGSLWRHIDGIIGVTFSTP